MFSAAKSRLLPNGTAWPAKRNLATEDIAGRDLAPLVKLPVRRQIGFRNDAEKPPAMDHERRVVEPAGMAERRADDQHGGEGGGLLQHRLDGLFHRVQNRVLEQQILDRIAGQCQFREDRHRHAAPVAVTCHRQHGFGIAGGVRQRRLGGAGGHPGKPLSVERTEVHVKICRGRRPRRNPSEAGVPAVDGRIVNAR